MPHRPSTAETPLSEGVTANRGTFLYAKKAPSARSLDLTGPPSCYLVEGANALPPTPSQGREAAGGSQPPVMPPSPHQLYSRRRRKTLTHKGSYWATPTPTAQVLRVLKDREAKEPLCLEVLKRTSKIATQQIALKRAISPA
ncbi:hypothetical protein PUN28_020423 [Cardiocondyla obscurior]|uniref:Uncharacterized protein n=1 Tax=Cardiocondyla obscurior TaxID=286306 RepID=A0AAW2E9M3_9HYME